MGRISDLVETMLSLQQQHYSSRTDHERASLIRQVSITDSQIDELVNRLYGLTANDLRATPDAE